MIRIAINYSFQVNTVIVGLGAGLLPMFLHGCMQFLNIEVAVDSKAFLSSLKEHLSFFDESNWFWFDELSVS